MWESKKQLRAEAENAEQRAVIYALKINTIEKILKNADKNKEMYYETVDRIKKVVYSK